MSQLKKEGIFIRDWKKFDPARFNEELANNLFDFSKLEVQQHADCLDQALLKTLDNILPEKFINHKDARFFWSTKIISLERKRETC